MTRAAAAVAPFEFQTATRMVFGRDALERVPALVRELATLAVSYTHLTLPTKA